MPHNHTSHPITLHHHPITRSFLIITLMLLIVNACSGQTTLCFSDNRECEKGYAGKVKGISLYYEVWNVREALSYHTTSLLLRTDTLGLDSLDFCFDRNGQTDSIFVTRTKSDTTIQFVTRDAHTIPSLFQTLIRAEYSYNHYYRFNEPGSSQKLFIRGSKLYLVFIQSERFATTYTIVTRIYRYKHGQFAPLKTREKNMQEPTTDD